MCQSCGQLRSYYTIALCKLTTSFFLDHICRYCHWLGYCSWGLPTKTMFLFCHFLSQDNLKSVVLIFPECSGFSLSDAYLIQYNLFSFSVNCISISLFISVQNVAINISSLSAFYSLSLEFLHWFFPLSAKNTIKVKKQNILRDLWVYIWKN